jgi:hypothetical protein
MLSHSELLGVLVVQSADDGERSQLWFRSKPVLDRDNVRIELGRHANPRLIRPLGSPVGGTRIAGFHGRAERLRKSDCSFDGASGAVA